MTSDSLEFTRDRLTWVAYAMLAWFAFLQAAPGLVIGHLRDELELSYSVGGMHVAAFAGGSMLAGLVSGTVERALSRRLGLWVAAALMGVGTLALTAGRVASVTIGSVLVMGLGGGLLLTTLQATLSDHHRERRTIALAEANVAASVAYLGLIGVLSLVALLHVGWRAALLGSLLVPVLLWVANRDLAFEAQVSATAASGRLPGVFWVAAGMLFCTTAAEWCITAWGATYAKDATGVSTDTAVGLMGGFFGGVLVGRVIGSGMARRHEPARLLAIALGVAIGGFVVLWPATTAVQAVAGLALLGIGLGNLFPMAISVTVALAPDMAALVSGRAVAMSALAVLLAPLAVGGLADATSLQLALCVVPALLGLSAAALAVVRRTTSTAPRPTVDAGQHSASGRLSRPATS
jgi:fucose permease